MQAESPIPQWGGPLSRALGRGLLRLLGWKLDVHLPPAPKLVVLCAPHTSNWDGVLAVTAMLALGIRVHWFGKDSLFRWPFKGLLIWLGGVPIARGNAQNVVDQTAAIFAQRERFYVGVAPEGTRSRAPVWKSGFYRIALAAGAPILPAYLDYARKCIGTAPALTASGDYEADLETLQSFYRGVTPKHPERFAAEA